MSDRPIILLAGPSGSGKSRLAHGSHAVVFRLDDFYRDGTDPGLPRARGTVDWDDLATWDCDDAVAALAQLARTGTAAMPVYDIARSARVGMQTIVAPPGSTILAEGIFAVDALAPARAAGLDVRPLWLDRGVVANFWRRLARDLAEHRKPPAVLVTRGLALAAAEGRLRDRARRAGFERAPIAVARAIIGAVPPPPALEEPALED